MISEKAPHVPAAFINVLAEEGSRTELINALQQEWNENCRLRQHLNGRSQNGGDAVPSDDVVRELREALAHAAVPLEGLTLAAHYSQSNLGLSKVAWDEINNAVSRIRAALPQNGGA